jgi:two-component system chemotaxis response regulator CheY
MATIMIADDAEFLRMRISKLLMNHGHSVIQADNGLSAVSMYRAAKPDIVLMDITMPEMDGLTALAEIRSADPAARVLMLTALGQETVVIEAIKAGARDYIVKPFEADRVLAAVNKALTF